jgi:hypothetical protein
MQPVFIQFELKLADTFSHCGIVTMSSKLVTGLSEQV